MKKVSFFIHWTYIKKRKYIFELELRKHLKSCNRVIEIYRIKESNATRKIIVDYIVEGSV